MCYSICKKMGESWLHSMQRSCNAGATFGRIRLSPIFLHNGATCCIVFSYLGWGHGTKCEGIDFVCTLVIPLLKYRRFKSTQRWPQFPSPSPFEKWSCRKVLRLLPAFLPGEQRPTPEGNFSVVSGTELCWDRESVQYRSLVRPANAWQIQFHGLSHYQLSSSSRKRPFPFANAEMEVQNNLNFHVSSSRKIMGLFHN